MKPEEHISKQQMQITAFRDANKNNAAQRSAKRVTVKSNVTAGGGYGDDGYWRRKGF
jgi:hypothetical protein